MKVFTCKGCGQLLYFENSVCVGCGRTLGYLPDRQGVFALEPAAEAWKPVGSARRYKFCANAAHAVCNWMLPAECPESHCAACRHNHLIPDLTVNNNLEAWRKIEIAKHRLFYTLLRFKLPLTSRANDPERGLAFDFLAETPQAHGGGKVMTGHADGLITLAAHEANDADRERIRAQMGEPYRTLLGHFRHEIGHYFWDVLVRDGADLERFRQVFGDETRDYAQALQIHYASGAPADWQLNFVSTYASSHPWEDFAETWAHYLHIVDTLETAQAFGMRVAPRPAKRAHPATRNLAASIDFDPYAAAGIEQLIDAWLPLSFAMNSLNRSMGQADLYPFILSPGVIGKLGYVHALIHGRREAGIQAPSWASEDRSSPAAIATPAPSA